MDATGDHDADWAAELTLLVCVRARPIWTPERASWAGVGLIAEEPAFEETIREALGAECEVLDGDDDAPWQAECELSPSDAIRVATALQITARPLARRGSSVQAAVVIVGLDEDPESAFDFALGGQIICSPDAREILELEEGSRYCHWQPRGQGRYWECSYDDPLALLEPPFERMFAAEFHEWVLPRRYGLSADDLTGDPRSLEATRVRAGRDEPGSPYAPDVSNDLYGIALSGGGMRSATFSLGVLQVLSREGMLEPADYLSSVSGGGYAAASLAGLCAEDLPYRSLPRFGLDYDSFPYAFPRWVPGRTERPLTLDDAEEIAHALPVHSNETPAVWHIRKHARLLGNSIGLFDLTTWLSVGRYLASTLALWLLFILPLVAVPVLIAMWIWLWIWERAEGLRTLLVLSPVIFSVTLLLILGTLTLVDRTLPERQDLRALLRGLSFVSAMGLLALAIGGGAWAIEHGADWWGEVAAGGVLGGGILTAIGSILMPSPDKLRGLAARLLFSIGGYLLLGGLLVWATWGAAYVMGATGRDPLPNWIWLVISTALVGLVALAALSIVISITRPGSARGVLNRLSLSDLYETRIEQAWITTGRQPGPDLPPNSVARWSGVWPGSHLTLRTLRDQPVRRSAYPLICATLSLPGSRGEKLPERKADSFLLAPLFSGSALSRWARTETMRDFAEMPLARAAAISGAAVSPNMGERTSTALSIIITLLNMRVGRWMENPRPSSRPRGQEIFNRLSHVLYVREMLGQATREDTSIYLSDGGHFDNLGVYELFRRRCRYIIAISSDIEDPDQPDQMGNLGNALRMARVDFGVEITLGSLKPLLRDPETRRVVSYYVVGRIRYPHPPTGADPDETLADPSRRREINSGYFVFIKSGLVEDNLSPDLLQYLGSNPSFPYDPTTDQQFDQPQFESYRQLGFLAARAMFDDSPAASRPLAPLHDRFAALYEGSAHFRQRAASPSSNGAGPCEAGETEAVSSE